MNEEEFYKPGFSLLEVIIALGLFVFLAASVTSLLLGGSELLLQGGKITQATALQSEAIDVVRAIKNRSWNELKYSQSAIFKEDSFWSLAGEGSSEQIDEFSRIISFLPVYRNEQGDIVAEGSPGALLDVSSQYVSVEVSWENAMEAEKSRQMVSLLTNWASQEWEQTDWSGGSGQSVWLEINRYQSDDGQINSSVASELSLAQISSTTFYTSASLESSAFYVEKARSFNFLTWSETIPSGCASCEIRVQIKTAGDDSGSPDSWSDYWAGPEGEDGDEDDYFSRAQGEMIDTSHNQDEWIKYKIFFVGDSSYTPVLDEIKINYSE